PRAAPPPAAPSPPPASPGGAAGRPPSRVATLLGAPALPFRPAAEPARPPAAVPEPAVRPSPAASLGQTSAMVDPDAIARFRQALPFLARGGGVPDGDAPAREPEAEGGVPTLTLEQYASLCAECEACPERAAEIQARYQVPTEAVRRALEQRWRDDLARDPALGRRWEESRARYQAWLREHKA
ncbi:MAG: hypothetical protein HY744_21950, partial [Deltaproteobacteria bacterium]|nr:hypothetical protein [Deltaproteobacteria bacterium]